MAARQDQTLQIALIVFAILLVMCLGFMYWFYKQSSDASQRITALESERDEERSRAGNLQAEAESLRGMMGFEQFAETETVEGQFDDDMERMGSTLPEAERNYRDVLLATYAENQRLAAAQAADRETINDLETTLAQVEAGHQAQIARLEADKAQIEQDAAAERNAFQEARAELDANKQALADQLASQAETFDQEQAELTSRMEEALVEAQTRQRTIDRLLEERAVEGFSFEVADGRVTWVNQGNNTVWINLGSADYLRRQVTFSVYDTEESDAGKAEKKGSIEVVRMLGDHLAECRITNDDPRDPILPGDYIYSPVWHHGRPQHFALTGVIDLDGDGSPDLQLAEDLIALNGGVVDAAPNPETGEQEGEMTVDTRYMVYGERSNKPSDAALRETWDDMHQRANALGVELISVSDFMNQMGYKPTDRTVDLGTGSQASDFRPRSAPGEGGMRPRSPYVVP